MFRLRRKQREAAEVFGEEYEKCLDAGCTEREARQKGLAAVKKKGGLSFILALIGILPQIIKMIQDLRNPS